MQEYVRVERMLDISTGHVTKDTCENYNAFVLARYEYGVIFFLPNVVDNKISPSDIKEDKIPEDLLAVFNFAILNGCHYVKLDCDGTVYDELALYVW